MGRYNYTQALLGLTEWAYGQGFKEVIFDHAGVSEMTFDHRVGEYESKKIKIEGKYTKELQVYLLLHELGHHQLRKSWVKFEKELPIMAYAEHIHLLKKNGKYKRRVTYNVSCMEEEFKAWDEGLKLAEKLGIKVNVVKWNELRSKCLISYMRYYSVKKS